MSEKQKNLMHEFEKYPELTADILYLYRNGKGFNLMWWGKFLANINSALTKSALTEAPKVDVEELYKGSRRLSSLHTGRVALVESQHDEGWNDCLDHITTHYHLVKKEKKHD